MGRKHSKRKVTKRRNTKRRVTKRINTKRRNTKRRNTNRVKNKSKFINGYKIIKCLNPHKNSIKYGGSWKIGRQLGKGGNGSVYLAEKEGVKEGVKEGEKYAMKFINFRDPEGYDKRMFLDEIEILQLLTDRNIQNVCHYVENWEFKNGDYVPYTGGQYPGGVIVMSYIDGPTLGKLIKMKHVTVRVGDKPGKSIGGITSAGKVINYVIPVGLKPGDVLQIFTEEECISSLDLSIYMKQLTEILINIHALGIFHNDIKPDNIIISGKQAYLIDFGNARAGSRRGSELYTPSYSMKVNYNTVQHDTYSLIIILYDFMCRKYQLKSVYEIYNDVIEGVIKDEWNERQDPPKNVNFKEDVMLLSLKGIDVKITDNYIELISSMLKWWLSVIRGKRRQANYAEAATLSENINNDISSKLKLIIDIPEMLAPGAATVPITDAGASEDKLIEEYKEYFTHYIQDDEIFNKYIDDIKKSQALDTINDPLEREIQTYITTSNSLQGMPFKPILKPATHLYKKAESALRWLYIERYNNIFPIILHKLYNMCEQLELQTDSVAHQKVIEHKSFIEKLESIKTNVSNPEELLTEVKKFLELSTYNYDPTIKPIYIALPKYLDIHINSNFRWNYQYSHTLTKEDIHYGFLLPPSEDDYTVFRVIYHNGTEFVQRGTYSLSYYDNNIAKFKYFKKAVDSHNLKIMDDMSDIPLYPIIIDENSIPTDSGHNLRDEIIEKQQIESIKSLKNKKKRIVYNVNKLYDLEGEIIHIMGWWWLSSEEKHRIEDLNMKINNIAAKLTYCANRGISGFSNYCGTMINAFIYNELKIHKGYPHDLLEDAKTKYKEAHEKEPDPVTVAELARNDVKIQNYLVEQGILEAVREKVKGKLRDLNISVAS